MRGGVWTREAEKTENAVIRQKLTKSTVSKTRVSLGSTRVSRSKTSSLTFAHCEVPNAGLQKILSPWKRERTLVMTESEAGACPAAAL